MNTVIVPQLPWHGIQDLKLTFPDTWQVEICRMAGYNHTALSKKQIEEAVQNPVGMPPLRELARGRKEAVIIFDDMTRATKVYEIVPSILRELSKAGITDEHIRFIAAIGLHGVMNRTDFIKKLGEDIVTKYPVYNHNPFTNCQYVGATKVFGTKVYVNEEVVKCDLKIAIGSVVPHPIAGFGGGSKIILPGITSYETTEQNHSNSIKVAMQAMKNAQENKSKPNIGMGVHDQNPVPLDSDEAAEMVKLDMLVNTLINERGESVSIYAGAFKEVYTLATGEAKTHYITPAVKNKDIIIANTFAKSNEALIGLVITLPALSRNGGDIVIITNAPEGQIPHYLTGAWGKTTFAKQYTRMPLPPYLNKIIVYDEYPHPGSRWMEASEKVIYLHEWQDVVDLLTTTHGDKASLAVYPSADIQFI